MTTRLTDHFTLEEFTHSQLAERNGFDNSAPAYVLPNLQILARGMEQVREMLHNYPITISSGYRSPEVNKAVGSKPTSQHCSGNACDFICPYFGPPAMVMSALVNSGLQYDQLILEYASNGGGWVHISFSDRNRRQALIINNEGTRGYAA